MRTKRLGQRLRSFKTIVPIVLFLIYVLQPTIWVNADTKGENIFVSLRSGFYNSNQLLTIESLVPNARIYYSFDHLSRVQYLEPIPLTAIEGEVRKYDINIYIEINKRVIGSAEYSYTIDKKRPKLPAINLNKTEYKSAVSVIFSPNANEKLYYAIDTNIFANPIKWDGNPLLLDAPKGKKKKFNLYYYTTDEAGNRSEIGEKVFTITHEKPYLEVKSPSNGEYGNYQFLFIKAKNIKLIKYTLDGSDPMQRGINYEKPLILKRSGRIVLSVVGIPYRKNEGIIRKNIEFSVIPEKELSLLNDTESGIYKNGLKINLSYPGKERIFYTLEERSPKEFDFLFSKDISLPSMPGFVKYYVLRLRALKKGNQWGREYRYFYSIDRHRPRRPQIEVERDKSERETFKAKFTGDGESLIYYTLDNSMPDSNARQYKGDFSFRPRDVYGKISGKIVIRAVAISLSGVKSEEAKVTVPYNLINPKVPELEVKKVAGIGYSIRGVSGKGTRIVYEISNDGTAPALPNVNSPVLKEKKVISLPFGMEKEFRLIFASMDEFGNISKQTKKLSIKIDRNPPSEPELIPEPGVESYDHDLEVEVKTKGREKGKVFYELTSDGSIPLNPGEGSKEYIKAIHLKGINNQIRHFQLKLLLKDREGNISSVFGPYHYFIDLTEPEVPDIKAVTGNMIYNKRKVEIVFPPGSPTMHYTYAVNNENLPDPTLKDPVIKEKLVFNGEPNKEISYKVKLLPVSVTGKIIGKVKEFSFIIDLKPPEVPELKGFKAGKVYRSPVKVFIDSKKIERGTRVFLSYSTGDVSPLDPVKYGNELKDSMVFDVKAGEERSFKIRLTAIDKAGNRSLYDRFYSLKIDKKPPENFVISGIPGGGYSNGTVVLEMKSSDGAIYYNMTNDGSIPVYPTLESQKYNAPIIITGSKGKEITYRIFPALADEVGNFVAVKKIYSFTIDMKSPDPPEPPDTLFFEAKNGEKALLLIFKERENESIYYYVKGLEAYASPDIPPSDYSVYSKPIVVKRNSVVNYFSVDRAGNRSKLKSYRIDKLPEKLPAPIIAGVKNAGIYNRAVNIQFKVTRGTVKYEITLDGTEPEDVTIDSPVASDRIIIDAREGESLDIRIKARAFADNGERSDQSVINFVLDKKPPAAPLAIGITNGLRYENSKEVTLVSAEGKVYYALSTNGKDPEIPEPIEKNRYKGKIVLQAKDGEIRDYRIVAYTIDDAGNRSRDIPIWRVLIDRKIVYVAPDGNDLYEGTASKPLKSITTALKIAKLYGRKTIYIAQGKYELQKPLTITTNGIKLVGGFNASTWKGNRFGISSFTTGRYFKKGDSLLITNGEGIVLKNLHLTSEMDKCKYLIEMKRGRLSIVDSNLILNTKSKETGIIQTGGDLHVTGTNFSVGKGKTTNSLITHVLSTGGKLEITDCTFGSDVKVKKYTAIEIRGNRENLIKGVRIEEVASQEAYSIKAENAILKVSGATIRTGKGKVASIGIYVKNTQLEILNSKLITNSKAGYTTAIAAVNSGLMIQENVFNINGLFGATGVRMSNGDALIARNRIIGEKTSEFSYLLNIDGDTNIFNNIILGGRSGDSICIQIKGGTNNVINNTIIGDDGSGILNGIMVRGSGKTRIINNIIGRYGKTSGNAIVYMPKISSEITVKANDITGWENAFIEQRISKVEMIYKYQPNVERISIGDSENLNLLDNDPFGGTFDKNIEEPIEKTFIVSKKIDYHLFKNSLCVNGGINEGPSEDMDGQKRPAPNVGMRPMYDIGADEVY